MTRSWSIDIKETSPNGKTICQRLLVVISSPAPQYVNLIGASFMGNPLQHCNEISIQYYSHQKKEISSQFENFEHKPEVNIGSSNASQLDIHSATFSFYNLLSYFVNISKQILTTIQANKCISKWPIMNFGRKMRTNIKF